MQDQHRWGISTLGCPELSLPEAAALAERFGFRLLELRALSGSCKLAANLKLPENAGEFRRLAGEGRITLLGSGFGLSDPEADFRELEELSEIADAAGIAHIRIFGGMPFEHPVDDAAVAAARRNLERYRALGRRCRLALETHDGYSSAAKCTELFRRLGEPLPVVWDVHHTVNIGGEPFRESFGLLKENVIEVHLKDSRVESGRRLACLPAEGDFPAADFLAFLAEHSPATPVIFEYEKLWEPHLPPLETALEAFRKNWMRPA
ncbi:MAG TPA: sugar phosphate isomerase/epimerase [Victivallis vadensis]|nr:sugar phosphate isomerase/epimerase [Victivallis vadensis]